MVRDRTVGWRLAGSGTYDMGDHTSIIRTESAYGLTPDLPYRATPDAWVVELCRLPQCACRGFGRTCSAIEGRQPAHGVRYV